MPSFGLRNQRLNVEQEPSPSPAIRHPKVQIPQGQLGVSHLLVNQRPQEVAIPPIVRGLGQQSIQFHQRLLRLPHMIQNLDPLFRVVATYGTNGQRNPCVFRCVRVVSQVHIDVPQGVMQARIRAAPSPRSAICRSTS